jgi:hypothetical protein
MVGRFDPVPAKDIGESLRVPAINILRIADPFYQSFLFPEVREHRT